MDQYFIKDVQEQSTVNGGLSTDTVGSMKYIKVTERLSPGRFKTISNATWKEHSNVMGQLTGSEFNKVLNATAPHTPANMPTADLEDYPTIDSVVLSEHY